MLHTNSSSLSNVSAIVVVLGLKSRGDLMNIYEVTLARAQGKNRLNVRFGPHLHLICIDFFIRIHFLHTVNISNYVQGL